MAVWGKIRVRFRSWRWRAAVAVIAAVVIAAGALTARLIVFPAMGAPARVDAIVVLGGPGDRLDLGLQLAREGRAPYLVLSLGLPWVPPGICTEHVGAAQVICFHPDPDTTQGEAEGASQIAKQHGWQSIVLVTTRDQVWRAHLRFERCYSGQIYGIGSQISLKRWIYAFFYQWGAIIKAETVQRSC